MKILLLTDIPPSSLLTAGLVLDKLCRFLPPGSVHCFCLADAELDVTPPSDLEGVVIRIVDKPRERALDGATFGLGRVAEYIRGVYERNISLKRLLNEAARFGREAGVEAVWAVLEGQTCIQMAEPLAKRLDVPLYTQVWDPPSWWLSHNGADSTTRRLTLAAFDRALRQSRGVATASWAMTEAYDRAYNISSVPVIASHDPAIARRPPRRLHKDQRLIIGMAGQFYARDAWTYLLAALNAAGWIIRGKQVYVKVAGHHLESHNAPEDRIIFLGWLPQPDLVGMLAECDILYCPYPLGKDMDEVSRLSFPSKLVTYLAAGRPVAFHGAADSSPSRYVTQHQVGLVAGMPGAAAIYNLLDRLVRDAGLYARCAENASKAFEADFTLRAMQRNFYQFLGVSPANGPKAPGAPGPSALTLDDRRRRRKNSKPPLPPSTILELLSLFPEIRRLRSAYADLNDRNARLQSEVVSLKGKMQASTATSPCTFATRSAAGPDSATIEALAVRDRLLLRLLTEQSASTEDSK